ncbi:hypothetical protein [Spirosoma linguale]
MRIRTRARCRITVMHFRNGLFQQIPNTRRKQNPAQLRVYGA